MFEFVKTSNLALDELAKKDKKYKSILSQLKTLLSEIKGEFLTFDKAHKKVEQTTNEGHNIVKERFNEKLKMLNLNLSTFSNDIDHQIALLDQNYDTDTQKFTKGTNEKIQTIQAQIKAIEQTFNDLKEKALSVRSKEISDITKVIAQLKKASAQSTEKLEHTFKNEQHSLIETFHKNEADLHLAITEAASQYETDKAKINEVKNFYREQSDKKYLSIKNDYHQASTEFNKSLDKLKKDKDATLKKIHLTDEKNRTPIEDALNHLKIQYEQQKNDVALKYQEKLDNHKAQITDLTNQFNEQKEQLIQAHGDAISLINSKLSSYIDAVSTDRQERTAQLKIDVYNTYNEDEAKALNKTVKKHLRQQENDLDRQISRTEKETQSLLKQHYLKLQALETKFLEAKSAWRINGKKLVVEQKLENYKNEQNYHYQNKSLQLQLKTLKTTNEFEIERADINHLSKIAPLDLSLSVANAISEKDVNLLSNDTNYHLNHYQHQLDTLTHNFTVFKLNKEHELDILKLTKEHDLSVLNMTLQLSIDKENVIREQQLNNQQLKKDFSVYTYEKSVLSEELIYLRQKALYENDITHLEKLERNHHHFLSEKRIIEQNLLKTKRTLEATNIHYLERTESVDMTNEMMIKDLEVIHSRIHHLFNQVYLIYNIHHHFMLSLIQIYEIPAHPEDVKLYIQTYLEVFSHLNTLQEYAKDQFLVDLNQFQEIKINDLSALKLKTDIDLLESEYITKIKNIDEEIQTNQQQIQQIEDRILILSSNVDRVQFDLNAIDDKDTHKTTSSNKKQLEKQLNGIETDIALLDKTVETHNRQIAMLSTRKNRLENELSKKRQRTTIKNQREATSYRKQKSFYIHSVKQITQLFKTYEDKVMILTKKIDQPIYLTDNIIKEYQKGYLRVEDFFEKSSNQLYQSLLKGSVKLFDQLIKQQNTSKDDFLSEQKTLLKKLDKEQMSLENKFKSIESEYKQHIKLLNDEKDVIVKNIQSAQFKTQEQDILYKQKLLQSTESKILATETNLNKETVLIDDNLNSVVDQMKADFDKQILKLNQGHDKTIAKHVEQLESKFKELKSLEESTQLKNNQLSIKFTQTENKLFEANKQKLTNFEQSIHKKHALLLKKIHSFANELKSAQDKKDSLIINNEKKLSKFIIKIENYEKDLLIKELKDVRQSYAFKQRTLRL